MSKFDFLEDIFLGALKNPEEKCHCVSALKMLQKSKGLEMK
jgi:hypothetical protein